MSVCVKCAEVYAILRAKANSQKYDKQIDQATGGSTIKKVQMLLMPPTPPSEWLVIQDRLDSS